MVEKRFVDDSGNEIIISVDDDDLDFDIEDGSIPFDITIEEGEEPTGDLVISRRGISCNNNNRRWKVQGCHPYYL